MGKFNQQRKPNPNIQVGAMKKYFPDFKYHKKGNNIVFTGDLFVVPEIPIYTIRMNGMDVPISISYHAGGFRNADASSVVGLGWVLNCGGNISRQVIDRKRVGFLSLVSAPIHTNLILRMKRALNMFLIILI